MIRAAPPRLAASAGRPRALERLARAVILLEGWRRLALAFAAGTIAALALAPLDFLPALFAAFPLLVWLLDGAAEAGGRFGRATILTTAAIGWSFGFGYFLAGLWWLGAAFIAGGPQFVPLMPLGVIGLPIFLAIFPAFGLLAARLLWSSGPARFAALAVGLAFSEWLRSFAFTGFPWNGFGQAFANHLTLAQAASLIGAEGLGLLIVLVAAAPAALGTSTSRSGRFLPPVLGLAIIAGLFAFGSARLGLAGGPGIDFARLPVVPGVKLRIMQPNVPQEAKGQADAGRKLFADYIELSDRAAGPGRMGAADATHLIWPEAPLPFVLERSSEALTELGRLLSGGTLLITGAIRAEDAPPGASRRYRFFNALQSYDRNGLIESYDKVHLVPFGEYLPFEPLLRLLGLEEFVHVIGGFTAGSERKAFAVAGLPRIVPLICFESIFPHETDLTGTEEHVLVNVTNDAWFGNTPGPYQHFAQARLRAIEFGTPLIRAANSGISAVVDPYGRIVATLPLGVRDILDSPLPAGLPPTFYRKTISTNHQLLAGLALFLAVAGILVDRRRKLANNWHT